MTLRIHQRNHYHGLRSDMRKSVVGSVESRRNVVGDDNSPMMMQSRSKQWVSEGKREASSLHRSSKTDKGRVLRINDKEGNLLCGRGGMHQRQQAL